ncbi:MAG: hypothetical protein GEV06_24470 [Luteitalea sp.]|nr:hypothetical protein [Luteitalea sp.]
MAQHRMTRMTTLCLVALFLHAPVAEPWGLRGHRMQIAATMNVLPADMPAFFRTAGPQLRFLSTEPDRWRTPESPAVVETSGPNHFFSYERAPKVLPRNRHLFLVELIEAGMLDADRPSLAPFGLAPYAIQEWADMLSGAFRRWRGMGEDTVERRTEKRQLEQSILFIAGALAHWVTDMSQPMHCSVHLLGWHPSVPNPHGYATDRSIHGRYETDYVDRVIDGRDVEAALTQRPVELGDWLEESSRYIAACNGHVETIYRWDSEAPFGSGRERAEAKPFTAERLAEGAAMLRDVWVTAWRRSAKSPYQLNHEAVPGRPRIQDAR